MRSLLYTQVCIRPDIAFVVGVLGRRETKILGRTEMIWLRKIANQLFMTIKGILLRSTTNIHGPRHHDHSGFLKDNIPTNDALNSPGSILHVSFYSNKFHAKLIELL
ncbi:hypothetical protein CR513_37656, partial [Mucuna pruriens]